MFCIVLSQSGENKEQERQTNNIIDLDFTHFKSTQEIEYTKDPNDTVQ